MRVQISPLFSIAQSVSNYTTLHLCFVKKSIVILKRFRKFEVSNIFQIAKRILKQNRKQILEKREKPPPLSLLGAAHPSLLPGVARQAAQLGPAQPIPPLGGFLQKVIFFPADQSCSVAAARPPDAPAGQDHLRRPPAPIKPSPPPI
jgi:hypothetical protein